MRDRPRVLVLTANMGAGHHQVGLELSRRLAAHDVDAVTVDVGEILPRGWGRGLTTFYKFMACRAQPLYDIIFRLSMCPPQSGGAGLLPLSIPAEKRLAALVASERPALLLSNFHLCSQIAGRMRAGGRLGVPVVCQVLDFFVHGMWAHPGVDAHLLLHPVQAPRLAQQGGRNPVICGPVVRPLFDLREVAAQREAARRSVGLREGQRCALVVAGSWGVGDIAGTLRALLADERVVPVVVTGHNRRLRHDLSSCGADQGRARVFGWVDEMDRLMAAADVVVENAGGLTAMEAMAAGVPVITYSPIAGHGQANAAEMAHAGVSLYARGPSELTSLVDLVTSGSSVRQRLVARGRSMFEGDADPAAVIAHWSRARSTRTLPAGTAGRRADVTSLMSGGR